MSEVKPDHAFPSALEARAARVYGDHLDADYHLVDRLFSILLLLEWMAAIIVALVVSPWAWSGESRDIHIHVWAAVVLGGIVVGLPVALARLRPGRASTRQCVAAGQMLLAALIIHLAGGRPEAHFHVFVSLAFLAFYRDGRVLATASVVIAADHYLRGAYWPRSVFGPLGWYPWRWLEHSLWVAFEVAVLTVGTCRARALLRDAAHRQAEVEASRDRVEQAVAERTLELRLARDLLEDRVRERTADLERANESLRGEVAERLRTEADLRASEERFRTLAEALPQIVWVTDGAGSVGYFNARWYEYTGRSPERSLGAGWLDVVHPDDLRRTVEAWGTATSAGSDYQIEYRLRCGGDDSYRWHLGRALPIRREDGAILRWFGTCTDVDDQKRAADSLRRAHDELEQRVRERTAELERINVELLVEVTERSKAEEEAHRSREIAEEATRAKSEFLANMSHEIRTPMNAIVGMTELSLGMAPPPRLRENLEVVRTAADSLLGLIDDILDFSKVEAGKLDLDPVPFPPRAVVGASAETLALRAREKGLDLSWTVAPGVPDSLVGDPMRVRQVLLNLMGNAIKFTASGRVEVKVAREEGGDHSGCVLRFSVLDQGIGIPASRLSMIFDAFSQADGSTTRRFGGTGLGLSISSKLVELMGGRIWVESEVGRGSSFHFTARFGAAPAGSPEARPVPALDGLAEVARARLRILLVDDNELNRRVGRQLLERSGHEVRLAVDGDESIASYRSGGPFDLVLMDVQMPRMDGFEATSGIREVQARQGRRCPIVALTAHAMSGDRERCLAAGMDDHLSKPIRPAELARVLESATAAVRPDAEAVARFRAASDEENTRMAAAILRQDPSGLADAARRLVGSLEMFADEATLALAYELERAGRAGNLDGTLATLGRLRVAIRSMVLTPGAHQADPAAEGAGRADSMGLTGLETARR